MITSMLNAPLELKISGKSLELSEYNLLNWELVIFNLRLSDEYIIP
jgi:hypothetical protein